MVCLYWPELVRAITCEAGQRGELAAHRVGESVGEVLVLGPAEVLEGEHGQRASGPAVPASGRVRSQASNTPKPRRIISGWPAVGKTTIAENIAKNFNLKLWNGGDILKMMAFERGYSSSLNHDWWDTEEAQSFMNTRNSDPCFDKEVDNRLIDLVNKGNVVITSYTLPWISDSTINFWLHGSVDNRAKRMAMRDNINFNRCKKNCAAT